MKTKILDNGNNLGALIRAERKKAKITQSQLGKMIGLKESRVSKIEKGAPITPEVATFILGKLGSELQIKVVGSKNYDESELTYLMSVAHHYSQAMCLPLDKAYQYLETFKGIDFLIDYQEIEQTLSYSDIIKDLTRVCANNGGRMK